MPEFKACFELVIEYSVLFYSLLDIVKILVFEYITGGGFNKQALPDSLAVEGRLMLDALLNNLLRLKQLEIWLMLDQRLSDSVGKSGINTVIIKPEHDVDEEFARCVWESDLVWPIAPEFDGILLKLCRTVETLGKLLLNSPASAVAIAGNKYKTYQLLDRHHIAAVPTRMLASFDYTQESLAERTCLEPFGYAQESLVEGWMVKPIDGAGCADSYVISNRQDFEQMATRTGEYIIQPHLLGAKTSLSCLFGQGRGWLVCANLQRFELINRQYRLTDIVVNHQPDPGRYRSVIDQIAHALPELWGYVGIDLIETAEQCWVLEINPRLTTSFTGIFDALGINIAEAVLQLLDGEPELNPTCNQAVIIQTHEN